MMMGDPSIAPYFAEYGVEQIMSHQHAFLCVATGGRADHIGRSVRAAHGQLGMADHHTESCLPPVLAFDPRLAGHSWTQATTTLRAVNG